MRTAILLFTRDLRVHDHPALRAAAAEADRIVPLFVLDDALLEGFGAPNRVMFLFECLHDLRDSLAKRGAALAVRRGDTIHEVKRIADETSAETVYLSGDVSSFAQRRVAALRDARLDVKACPGITVVPPGALEPTGGSGAFKVFTPYWRRWQLEPLREVLGAPRTLNAPSKLASGRIPAAPAHTSPAVAEGGEAAARKRANAWIRDHLHDYEAGADDLAGDRTSRLSPYIHFGCISPRELVELAGREGEAFVRQLCWRDFHHQLLAADPRIAQEDQHDRGKDWNDDPDALAAWKAGETGVPLVDAGMKQLLHEGWMHNRARLVTGSYLTKTLGIDWREGARHFYELLVDGDVANNAGNWQWVAGTGADTRPNRRLNPQRQAKRFDPEGAYIQRWLGETDRLF
jgi:deoxyribodipyrimidine photo-lyase